MKESEMGGACGTCGRREKCIKGFGREREEEGPIARSRHRWQENNINFKETVAMS
jgi:hypothetical protein